MRGLQAHFISTHSWAISSCSSQVLILNPNHERDPSRARIVSLLVPALIGINKGNVTQPNLGNIPPFLYISFIVLVSVSIPMYPNETY